MHISRVPFYTFASDRYFSYSYIIDFYAIVILFLQVCINNLEDIQLALVVCRLYDGETMMPESAKKILS